MGCCVPLDWSVPAVYKAIRLTVCKSVSVAPSVFPSTRVEMKIYITHCSAKKSLSVKRSGARASPDKLYTSKRIQRFMGRCKERQVRWAIFSDLYGVYLPSEKHKWYEKSPDSVTPAEFRGLVMNFNKRLRAYSEICFYHHPARFHKLYRKLLSDTKLKRKVRLFKNVDRIM
jgi:hypothetical protein